MDNQSAFLLLSNDSYGEAPHINGIALSLEDAIAHFADRDIPIVEAEDGWQKEEPAASEWIVLSTAKRLWRRNVARALTEDDVDFDYADSGDIYTQFIAECDLTGSPKAIETSINHYQFIILEEITPDGDSEQSNLPDFELINLAPLEGELAELLLNLDRSTNTSDHPSEESLSGSCSLLSSQQQSAKETYEGEVDDDDDDDRTFDDAS